MNLLPIRVKSSFKIRMIMFLNPPPNTFLNHPILTKILGYSLSTNKHSRPTYTPVRITPRTKMITIVNVPSQGIPNCRDPSNQTLDPLNQTLDPWNQTLDPLNHYTEHHITKPEKRALGPQYHNFKRSTPPGKIKLIGLRMLLPPLRLVLCMNHQVLRRQDMFPGTTKHQLSIDHHTPNRVTSTPL